MEFAAALVLEKSEAFDMCEAMFLAAAELQRFGNREMAHRLRGQIDLLEDRLTPGDAV
ncbi:MAG: hypothetical protein M0Z30_13285 [Actinomycetota bacterium]|nr:hypothetical protein [Actinomycetota bacterium]